jgi:hypothetical protein
LKKDSRNWFRVMPNLLQCRVKSSLYEKDHYFPQAMIYSG